jgi:hypothetical protein
MSGLPGRVRTAHARVQASISLAARPMLLCFLLWFLSFLYCWQMGSMNHQQPSAKVHLLNSFVTDSANVPISWPILFWFRASFPTKFPYIYSHISSPVFLGFPFPLPAGCANFRRWSTSTVAPSYFINSGSIGSCRSRRLGRAAAWEAQDVRESTPEQSLWAARNHHPRRRNATLLVHSNSLWQAMYTLDAFTPTEGSPERRETPRPSRPSSSSEHRRPCATAGKAYTS